MEVVLKFHVSDTFQFPKFAGITGCDGKCPMFLWDGAGHDYCAAAQERTDDDLVRCPFFSSKEHIL